jgi:hypothetical protein
MVGVDRVVQKEGGDDDDEVSDLVGVAGGAEGAPVEAAPVEAAWVV